MIGLALFLFMTSCSDSSDDTTPPVDENITFPDAVVHDANFTSLHFSGSQNCAQCHDGIVDSNGTDVSIIKAWHSTMMANAATDPFWQAKVASEVKRHPEFREVIESKCSRCHTPMANVEAGFAGDPATLSHDGFLNPESLYYNPAMQGVSCTLCHQIEDTPELGTPEGFSGHFSVADNTGIARIIYGPYESPKVMPMQNSVEFTPAFSAHMNDSKHCATCHNLETPVIDTAGNITDFTFPEQAVYTEWEYSDFNATQSCQECHMPKAAGSVIISTKGSNLVSRSPFFQHKFLGANTYMLEIIKNNRAKIGPIADDSSFDTTITNDRSFLKAAADVNITETSVDNNGSELKFTVIIRNLSGHKFPTGFPSRRVWLHVTVTNEANQTVFESGAITDDGIIIGVDDETTANGYEPHYEKISDASQVQVYETILSDTDDNQTYILLHALHYLKDNRLLPLGFDKGNVPENVNPHGLAEDDDDFIGGSDTIEYEVDNLPEGDYTVTATLNYQSLSYAFAQDLFKDDDLTVIALMKALDRNATLRYETISSDTASQTLP